MQGRVTKAYYILTKEQLPRLAESAGAPRYELREGKPVFAGLFPELNLGRLCSFSAVCDWARGGRAGSSASPTELAAVLARMQEILQQRYHVHLTVLSWNTGEGAMDEVERETSAKGLDVVSVKTAIPDFTANPGDYVIPADGNPNSRATELLGKYLAERLRR